MFLTKPVLLYFIQIFLADRLCHRQLQGPRSAGIVAERRRSSVAGQSITFRSTRSKSKESNIAIRSAHLKALKCDRKIHWVGVPYTSSYNHRAGEDS